MKNTIFTGAATAIVTPMTAEGVDYERFGKLIDWQIESGIDAIASTAAVSNRIFFNTCMSVPFYPYHSWIHCAHSARITSHDCSQS